MTPRLHDRSSITTCATSSARRFPASRHCRWRGSSRSSTGCSRGSTSSTAQTFERARCRAGFDRPTALLTFDDGFVDHYEHVFPLLRDRGPGGIFFIAGRTLGTAPVLLNVHKTHFLLSHLGADRFTEEVAAALEREGVATRGSPDGGRHLPLRRSAGCPHQAHPELRGAVSRGRSRAVGDVHASSGRQRGVRARSVSVAGQIREMAQGGMTFGFHTEIHPVLSRLDAAAQRAELHDGPRLIGTSPGSESVSFCYPYGFSHTYNADTLSVLADCGYSMAFNTVRREMIFGQDQRYELPRFDTRDVARAHEVPAGA